MNGLLTSTNLLSGNLLRSMTWGVKEMTEGGGMEGCSDDGHAAEQGHSGFEWVDQWRRKTSWLEVANIRCPKPSTQPQVGTASALRLPPSATVTVQPRAPTRSKPHNVGPARLSSSTIASSSFKFQFLQNFDTVMSENVCQCYSMCSAPRDG